jgi:hypothetical protein
VVAAEKKVEREKEKAKKAAKQEREKQERDSRKAVKKAQSGKRKVSRCSAPKAKRVQRTGDVADGLQSDVAAPVAPARVTTRGRQINLPRKFK